MKGQPLKYSAAELAWIETNASLPRRQLHIDFQATFGRTDVSQANLTALCKRRGWLTGRTGRFTPGQTPANKGKPMPYHPNNAATRFKKGNRTGRANQLWKPIGSERLSKEGYIERKIHDGLPLQSRWRGVHLIRWEEIYGPVPDGHCLKCQDGDRSNTDPANWRAIPRAILPRLSGRWNRPYDSAPAEIKPTLMLVAELEHAARQARKS